VLQEIAAARQILVVSGSAEVDGHAFCTGLEFLTGLPGSRIYLQGPTCSVVSLMKGAVFRPRHTRDLLETSSLNICPLGNLIDMAHTHEASRRHDKVYALLGMASDDFSTAGISPDYSLPWEELLKRLVKFLLGAHVSVQTWPNKEMVLIDAKACVLGKITSVEGIQGNKQIVGVISQILMGRQMVKAYEASVVLSVSAKVVKVGDIICLLKGASKPTIIRPCKDHFAIIMIATSPEGPTEDKSVEFSGIIQSATSFRHDLLLVWDWEHSAPGSIDLDQYETVVEKNELHA